MARMWKTLIPLMLFASMAFSRGQMTTDAPDDGMSTTTPSPTEYKRSVYRVSAWINNMPWHKDLIDASTPFYQQISQKIFGRMQTSLFFYRPTGSRSTVHDGVGVIGFSQSSVIVHLIILVSSSPTFTAEGAKIVTRNSITSLGYTVGNIAVSEKIVTYTAVSTTISDDTIQRTEVTFRVVFNEAYLTDYNTPTSAAYIAKAAHLTKKIVFAYQTTESATSLKIIAFRITRFFHILGNLGVEYVAIFAGGATTKTKAEFERLTNLTLTANRLRYTSVTASGTWLPQSSGMGGLSLIVIAAIVIACVIVVVLIIILVIYLVKRPTRVACGS